jgi:hypothetical protein
VVRNRRKAANARLWRAAILCVARRVFVATRRLRDGGLRANTENARDSRVTRPVVVHLRALGSVEHRITARCGICQGRLGLSDALGAKIQNCASLRMCAPCTLVSAGVHHRVLHTSSDGKSARCWQLTSSSGPTHCRCLTSCFQCQAESSRSGEWAASTRYTTVHRMAGVTSARRSSAVRDANKQLTKNSRSAGSVVVLLRACGDCDAVSQRVAATETARSGRLAGLFALYEKVREFPPSQQRAF